MCLIRLRTLRIWRSSGHGNIMLKGRTWGLAELPRIGSWRKPHELNIWAPIKKGELHLNTTYENNLKKLRTSKYNNMKITILVDTIDSWIHPWAKALENQFEAMGHSVSCVASANDIGNGDIAFLLGCIKLVPVDILHKNKHNIVVHPSDLPNGKGFSPLAWQVLEGKNEIPIVLFDAVSEADGGDIYMRNIIRLDGTELNEQIKHKQGIETFLMCIKFVEQYDELVPETQNGDESFYKRRTKEDSQLDPEKTIAGQFNLLRVVDNDRYPAFFYLNGERYTLHIFKRNLS